MVVRFTNLEREVNTGASSSMYISGKVSFSRKSNLQIGQNTTAGAKHLLCILWLHPNRMTVSNALLSVFERES